MKIQFFVKDFILTAIALLISILMAVGNLAGQDSMKKERARLSLEHITSNMDGRQLKATVKAKLDVSYVGIPDIKLDFYHTEVDEKNLMGSSTTGQSGVAVLTLPASGLPDMGFPTTYWVLLENNPMYNDVDQDIEIKPAKLEVDSIVEDSIKVLSITITSKDSSNADQPIADLPVQVLVKRLFGLLPITEGFETTDEDGKLEIEFPENIPGDGNGAVTIITRVEEDDIYGTLINESRFNWGVPLAIDPRAQRRELWSSRANAPLYLIIIVNGMILGIWSIIALVVSQIVKIKRLANGN